MFTDNKCICILLTYVRSALKLLFTFEGHCIMLMHA